MTTTEALIYIKEYTGKEFHGETAEELQAFIRTNLPEAQIEEERRNNDIVQQHLKKISDTKENVAKKRFKDLKNVFTFLNDTDTEIGTEKGDDRQMIDK